MITPFETFVVREDGWRPTCSIDALIERSKTLRAIRGFFADLGVLEIDTPVLSSTTVTEPEIESLSLLDGGHRRYLQTSPEYHMKRLIAAGAPSIVRIGPVFRANESGRLHNPEFTMIEWYRLGFDLGRLMAEVESLVDLVLGVADYDRLTYAQLLNKGANINAFCASDSDLAAALDQMGVALSSGIRLERRAMLDLLVAHAIGATAPRRMFITDYPDDQAALARVEIDVEGRRVAKRFELVVNGIEIANGYDELIDADALANRMATDNTVRALAGRDQPAADLRLLTAMRHGLPSCAGVALGFDRLMMLKLGVDSIDAVLPFGITRA